MDLTNTPKARDLHWMLFVFFVLIPRVITPRYSKAPTKAEACEVSQHWYPLHVHFRTTAQDMHRKVSFNYLLMSRER